MSAKLLKDSAIIHGNNEFGRYIKFSNGDLICWRYIRTTPNYVSTWGNFNFFNFINIQFPHEFADPPFVSVTVISGPTYILGQVKRDAVKLIECELFKNDSAVQQGEFYMFAIGRWK